MTFRGKCNGCRKNKFFIKKRTYLLSVLGVPITSDGELCRSCYKEIKAVVNENNNRRYDQEKKTTS